MSPAFVDSSQSSSHSSASSAAMRIETVSVVGPGGQRISVQVEIADTDPLRQTGLMSRTELLDGQGMLFVFDQEQVLQFWMKNTLIPLDILYFAADGRLLSISTMTPCAADPCPLYASEDAARYALEVPAGTAARHGMTREWVLQMHE